MAMVRIDSSDNPRTEPYLHSRSSGVNSDSSCLIFCSISSSAAASAHSRFWIRACWKATSSPSVSNHWPQEPIQFHINQVRSRHQAFSTSTSHVSVQASAFVFSSAGKVTRANRSPPVLALNNPASAKV